MCYLNQADFIGDLRGFSGSGDLNVSLLLSSNCIEGVDSLGNDSEGLFEGSLDVFLGGLGGNEEDDGILGFHFLVESLTGAGGDQDGKSVPSALSNDALSEVLGVSGDGSEGSF